MFLSSGRTDKDHTLTRITEWSLYSTDNLVRRALALQACAANDAVGLFIHPTTAQHFNLQHEQWACVRQQGAETRLRVYLDADLATGCVLIRNGVIETSFLGESFGAVEVTPL